MPKGELRELGIARRIKADDLAIDDGIVLQVIYRGKRSPMH
jgi:hypothetical protein